MTGKEVLFKTLRHEETERPAWVPMAGVHAGFLKGYTADEVYQDADKLVESLLEVEKMYAPDGLILLFAAGSGNSGLHHQMGKERPAQRPLASPGIDF